jgi:hypothetical protein
MLTPSSHANYFFYCSRAKDSQRFSKRCAMHEFILLSPSGQSIALPAAAWQLRYILFF